MEQLVTTVLGFVPENAIALVAVVVLYFVINKQRKDTKYERDKDSESVHDELLKHRFEIQSLKDNQVLHNTILEDLRNQVSILNTNISKLTVQVEMLCKSWRGEK